ncbi:MAG: hypothetical protein ACP5MH_11995, partial [Thermoproteus sp.]
LLAVYGNSLSNVYQNINNALNILGISAQHNRVTVHTTYSATSVVPTGTETLTTSTVPTGTATAVTATAISTVTSVATSSPSVSTVTVSSVVTRTVIASSSSTLLSGEAPLFVIAVAASVAVLASVLAVRKRRKVIRLEPLEEETRVWGTQKREEEEDGDH